MNTKQLKIDSDVSVINRMGEKDLTDKRVFEKKKTATQYERYIHKRVIMMLILI